MDTNSRLRIATRIHFALLRHFNEDVDVRLLLNEGIDAQEALWVCEGSGHPELVSLAQQFTAACQSAAQARRQVGESTEPSVPQDLLWSEDTSGFGWSRPFGVEADHARVPSSRPIAWLRDNAR